MNISQVHWPSDFRTSFFLITDCGGRVEGEGIERSEGTGEEEKNEIMNEKEKKELVDL